MLKTLFFHQYLQHLGLETFFSHHYFIIYQKTVPNYFSFIFQIWGPPWQALSTYNFPYWKVSARIFFFKLFWCTNFFFLFPLLDFYFCFFPTHPTPHHFSNGLPLYPLIKLSMTWLSFKTHWLLGSAFNSHKKTGWLKYKTFTYSF